MLRRNPTIISFSTWHSRGCWIELDGLGPGTEEAHLVLLLKLLDSGYGNRILLSQDSGWYHVGEEKGGEVRPYTYLPERFLTVMNEQGIDDETLQLITVENPRNAFMIG